MRVGTISEHLAGVKGAFCDLLDKILLPLGDMAVSSGEPRTGHPGIAVVAVVECPSLAGMCRAGVVPVAEILGGRYALPREAAMTLCGWWVLLLPEWACQNQAQCGRMYCDIGNGVTYPSIRCHRIEKASDANFLVKFERPFDEQSHVGLDRFNRSYVGDLYWLRRIHASQRRTT